MHHALQCRELNWSCVFDTDRKQAAQSRRRFLAQAADTSILILPIDFPNPTVAELRLTVSAFAKLSLVKSKRSECGTFETCRPALKMSADRRR